MRDTAEEEEEEDRVDMGSECNLMRTGIELGMRRMGSGDAE